jgi:asparagine synthase (glutamine-hydrolysing)
MLHDTSRRHGALWGIEPRHPLLDVDLVEFALSLPPELAFDRRYNRPVLRQAVQGLVPDDVRLRPYKSNFDPVFIEALDADLPVIEGLVLAEDAETQPYVDRSALELHFSRVPSAPGARRERAMGLWQLATIECWLRSRAGRKPLPEGLIRMLAPPRYDFVGLTDPKKP